MINITIDMRERDLLACCKMIIDKHPTPELVNLLSAVLPIGDIIISSGGQDNIIIERKTLADLSSSIKDGRYTEQSYRLNGIEHPNHNIVYLIEGDLTKPTIFKAKYDKQTLYSAMFSVMYYKGFSIMRSMSLEESAMIICNASFKMARSSGKVPYYCNAVANAVANAGANAGDDKVALQGGQQGQQDGQQGQQQPDYCSVVKRVKKDNITKANIGEIMLCQIPGISDVAAKAIFQKFGTIAELIIAIKDDATCLDNITSVLSNGKSRKISKTSIKSIIDFLRD
jgi:ERCC4-type nuclease